MLSFTVYLTYPGIIISRLTGARLFSVKCSQGFNQSCFRAYSPNIFNMIVDFDCDWRGAEGFHNLDNFQTNRVTEMSRFPYK